MYTVIQAFECAASARREPSHQRKLVSPSSKQLRKRNGHPNGRPSPSHESLDAKKDFSSSPKSKMQNVAFPGDNTLHSEVFAMLFVSNITENITVLSYYSPSFLHLSKSLIDTDSNFAFCAQQGKAVM